MGAFNQLNGAIFDAGAIEARISAIDGKSIYNQRDGGILDFDSLARRLTALDGKVAVGQGGIEFDVDTFMRRLALIEAGVFTPLSRFAGGKQGVFVDLNDFTTLWQDTARTVPITAAGQTVKGITDKSGNGNHITNATGWVLTADGSNYYLQTDGVSRFQGAGAIAWGSDKASIFFGAKKDSGTGGTLFQFGTVISQTGSFELLYQANQMLAYRRGSSTFGARQTDGDVGNNTLVTSTVFDLSGSTQATECPYLRVEGVQPSLTDNGQADSGTGNFGTYTIQIGQGQSTLTGRIYSFFVVADTSTLDQVKQGEAWIASRCGVVLANIAAPTPIFLDTGPTTDMGSYIRTSPFARADYTTTATELFIAGNPTIAPSFPTYTQLGVYVNGVYNQTVQSPASATQPFNMRIALSAGTKTVSIVNGLTSSPSLTQAFLGTFFTGATANAPMTALNTAATNRLVIYGDSIAVGANTAVPVQQAWAVLLRNVGTRSVALEAFGSRSLNLDCSTAPLRAAFVAKIVAYAPTTLYIQIGTNDYGLNLWTAAAFGTAYGQLLDDLHTALPSMAIVCQTPTVRTSEVANGLGSTLGDYRTAIATAQSTRSAYASLLDGTTILALADVSNDGTHPNDATAETKYFTNMRASVGI